MPGHGPKVGAAESGRVEWHVISHQNSKCVGIVSFPRNSHVLVGGRFTPQTSSTPQRALPVQSPPLGRAMASFYSADNFALQQWFNVVDADRSGQVNTTELQRALAQGGLNFSLKLVSSMIRMYDADKNAQLSLNQFIELHKFLVNVQRIFAEADHNRTGQLDLNECVPALNTTNARRTPRPDACGDWQDPQRPLNLGALPRPRPRRLLLHAVPVLRLRAARYDRSGLLHCHGRAPRER